MKWKVFLKYKSCFFYHLHWTYHIEYFSLTKFFFITNLMPHCNLLFCGLIQVANDLLHGLVEQEIGQLCAIILDHLSKS